VIVPALRAEWTKLRTLRSTGWLLLAAVVCNVGISAVTAWSTQPSLCPAGERGCGPDPATDLARLSLTGVYTGQVAVVVLAVLAVTAEYGTRTIQVTLAANPRRGTVYAAKAALVTALGLGVGLLGVAGSLLAARGILPGNGFTDANGYPALSLADGPTLRAAAGTVLYLALVALLSLGVGTVVRDTGVALSAVLVLLYIVPVAAEFMTRPEWRDWAMKLSPMTAGLFIQVTRGVDELPLTPWEGMGVLAAYAVAALTAGALVLRTRDA
jgi:ABC-2 type transport system permease protein